MRGLRRCCLFDALRIPVLINRTLWPVFYALSIAQKFLYPTYDFEFQKEHIMDEKICACGRSPNGNCIGWHLLSEEGYLNEKSAYEAKKRREA